MSPWLEICRAAVVDARAILARMPTIAERSRSIGQGEGGDITSAIDQAIESAVLSRLANEDVSVVSEERGLYGDGRAGPWSSTRSTARRTPNAGFRTSRFRLPSQTRNTMDDVILYELRLRLRRERGVDVGRARRGSVPERRSARSPSQNETLSSSCRSGRRHEGHPRWLRSCSALAQLTDRVRIMGVSQAITYCHSRRPAAPMPLFV